MASLAEIMKIKYYELIAHYCRKKPQHTLMRKQWVKVMLQRILTAKEIIHNEGANKLPKVARIALDNYDVISTDEKQTLMKKSKEIKPGKDKVYKEVIPLESSFEIVLNAHLCTSHGTSSDMFDWIEKCNFAVASICAPILREVCKTMNKDCSTGYVENLTILPLGGLQLLTNPQPTRTKDTASVTFLDMTLQPDNSFHYLLVYRDLDTRFVQLRPITATNLIEEMTMELMKLFCDFSPPNAILVDTNMKDTFGAVLDRLKSIFPAEILLKTCDGLPVDSQIEVKLTYWMLAKESRSWTVGCHFVQWDMNNAKARSGRAYENFFGIGRIVQDKSEIRTPANMTSFKADSPVSKNDYQDTQISKNYTHISKSSTKNVTELSKIIARDTVIRKNPVICQPNSTQEVDSMTSNVKNSTTANVNNSTTTNVNNSTTANVNNSTTANVNNSSTANVNNSTTANVNNSTTSNVINSIEPHFYVKVEEESGVSMETETHVCCTCELVIETKAYFCQVCKKSLHLYCGVSKQNSNGNMESVCFMCL